MKKYLTEFIGTFFLVLVIALTGDPLAIGAVLTALLYMGGYISGAQYNPAVTLAVFLSKKISLKNALIYMLSQMLAGICAIYLFSVIDGGKFLPQMGNGVTPFNALIVEIIFTFLLASVVLHTAVSDKNKGNNYFGIAIGFTVLAIVIAVGPVSGGVYNPAVGVSAILFDFTNIAANGSSLYVYLFGPLIGGVLASIIYKFQE